MQHILNHPGWITFIEQKWGLEARCIEFGTKDSGGTYAKATVFVNRSGKIRMPQTNPYIPIMFIPRPSQLPQRIESQWLEAAGHIAAEMDRLGYGGAISLAPSVTDVRPWQWRGHSAHARYTYYLDLPYALAQASPSVRQNIKKARRLGYTCERTLDATEVATCLGALTSRKGLSYGFTADDLESLLSHLGEEGCRFYVCRAANGEPVSARVVLHGRGLDAIDWLAGTSAEHLRSGATQMLIGYMLEDITEAGAARLDYEGANIEPVARSKSEWGGRLAPFYTIRPRTVRTIAQDSLRWLHGITKGRR